MLIAKHAYVLVNADIESGTWHPATRSFTPAFGGPLPNAVRVTTRRADVNDNPLNFFFGMTRSSYSGFIENTADVAHAGIITYPQFTMNRSIVANLRQFRQNGGKVVVLNTERELEEIPVIRFDDRRGGEIAARHLIAQNCHFYFADTGDRGRGRG